MGIKKKVSYEFHKWKKQLLILDKIIVVAVFVFLGIFRQDLLLLKITILLVPYLIITKRTGLIFHLMVAFTLSVIWNIIAMDFYGYNTKYWVLFGLNIFPLFGWALGLFALYLIFSHYKHLMHHHGFFAKLGLLVAIYWPILLTAETVAYHIFNIHNIAAAGYSGLPICDCILAPHWMQAAYFMMGPLFYLICTALRLENPHYKVVKG